MLSAFWCLGKDKAQSPETMVLTGPILDPKTVLPSQSLLHYQKKKKKNRSCAESSLDQVGENGAILLIM